MAVRNQTPPEVAKRYKVTPGKVIGWILSGELKALNLANRNCQRPRYSITPEALEQFELARAVVPEVKPIRRRSAGTGRDYFES